MAINRRGFIRGAGATVALAARALLPDPTPAPTGALGSPGPAEAVRTVDAVLPDGVPLDVAAFGDSTIDTGWRFGPVAAEGAIRPVTAPIPTSWAPVDLPHTATALGFGDWDHRAWERRWGYAREIDLPAGPSGRRTFVDFDAALTTSHVAWNGHAVGTNRGGYLPFSFEVTDLCRRGTNVLGVVVDGTWEAAIPPGQVGQTPGSSGADTIDFLQPAGLHRSVHLRTTPDVYVYDLFVNPQVADGSADAVAEVTVDSAGTTGPATVTVVLRDGAGRVARRATTGVTLRRGRTVARIRLPGQTLGLWSPEVPTRYVAWATVSPLGGTEHTVEVNTGFRQSSFTAGGYVLNGRPRKLFGISRHELYPWSGHAMGSRGQAADAVALKRDLNVDFVRAVHYPHDPAFLDACDELGLLVWQETPGWGNLGPRGAGAAEFDTLWAANNEAMVLRDRSRPSVIIWGTHPNEAPLDPALDGPRSRIARQLDPDRPTAGAVERYQYAADRYVGDVTAINDYESGFPDGSAGYRPRTAEELPATAYLERPSGTKPWLVTEAVGGLVPPYTHFQGDPQYAAMVQGIYHAQVHDQARSPSHRYAGLAAWTAIDYQSNWRYDPSHPGLRSPGVLDTFRNPKRSAGFYRSQGDPAGPGGPVVLPGFAWWFDGTGAVTSGIDAGDSASVLCLTRTGLNVAGAGRAVVWSNCDRVEVLLDGRLLTTLLPDRAGYPHLAHPPSWLPLSGVTGRPTLTLVGLIAGHQVLRRSWAPDATGGRLVVRSDAGAIDVDGSDATRIAVVAADRYGNHLPYAGGTCRVQVSGPGRLVGLGSTGFDFGATGGSGAVWVRAAAGARSGQSVGVTFSHPSLGTGRATVRLT